MKLALIGYGKMGKAIENLAPQRGHIIATTVDNDQQWEEHIETVKNCDMAIDFSLPTTAVTNIRRCFDINIPVVVGTTGWYDMLPAIVEQCNNENKSLFVASNFSIGMNIMFQLNRRLAEMINRYPEYNIEISETHHIHKLDAPSGTAITLARNAIERIERKESWMLTTNTDKPTASQIGISAQRIGEVPGIHTVTCDSAIDTITIAHSAKNRQGLALGALLAAEYLQGHKGYHTMDDLLQ